MRLSSFVVTNYTLCSLLCITIWYVNPLNAELNPIRHLLALVGVRHIVHVSRIRVNNVTLCSVVAGCTYMGSFVLRGIENLLLLICYLFCNFTKDIVPCIVEVVQHVACTAVNRK